MQNSLTINSELLSQIAQYDGHLAIASRTGAGKTTAILAIIAIKPTDEWLICSGKATAWMGLEDQVGKDGQPRVLTASLSDPTTIEPILQRLRWVVTLQEKREQIRIEKTKQGQKVNPKPIRALLDEWPILLKVAKKHSNESYKELIDLAEILIFKARQDKCYLWLAAQGHHCKTLHLDGDVRLNLGVLALGGAGNYQSITSAITDSDLIEVQSERETLQTRYQELIAEDSQGRIFYTSIGGHQVGRMDVLPDMEAQILFQPDKPEPQPEIDQARQQLEQVYQKPPVARPEPNQKKERVEVKNPPAEDALKLYLDQQERILEKQLRLQQKELELKHTEVQVGALTSTVHAEDRWNFFTLCFGIAVFVIYIIPPFSGALQGSWKAAVKVGDAVGQIVESTDNAIDAIAPALENQPKQGEQISGYKVASVSGDSVGIEAPKGTALYLVGEKGSSIDVKCQNSTLTYQSGGDSFTYAQVAQCASGNQQVGSIVARTSGTQIKLSKTSVAPSKGDLWQILSGDAPQPVIERGGTASGQGQRIAQAALKWAGKDFAPGQSEQCALFVRAALKDAGINAGVTQSPIDGHSTSEGFANSFFGADMGEIIKDKSQLKPGDLVAYGGTYGGYSKDTITHVGIYVGNGEIVDRPTASKPVQQRSVNTFEHFVAGVRLK